MRLFLRFIAPKCTLHFADGRARLSRQATVHHSDSPTVATLFSRFGLWGALLLGLIGGFY